MKKIIWIMFCACLILGCTSEQKCQKCTCKGASKGQLRFKFKEGSSVADVDGVVKAFMNLKNKIPQIKQMEWGLNNSPEHLNRGFTHCFTLTFANEADRDTYLPHPEHKLFGQVLGPHMDSVLVFDYIAK